eukprot:930268-Amphidinium_carterae.1
MPIPRNTYVVSAEPSPAVVSDDLENSAASVAQSIPPTQPQPIQEPPAPVHQDRPNFQADTAARFYCCCCPSWTYTPQKRYLHMAMQHT